MSSRNLDVAQMGSRRLRVQAFSGVHKRALKANMVVVRMARHRLEGRIKRAVRANIQDMVAVRMGRQRHWGRVMKDVLIVDMLSK